MQSPKLSLVLQTHRYDEDIFDGYTHQVASMMDTPPFTTLSDVAMQTEIFAHQWQLGIDALYCIIDSSGRFYGQVSLMDLQSETPEIGIWVAEKHQGKGVGKKALHLLLDEARKLGITKCVYPVRFENLRSISLVSGFSNVYEVANDMRIYEIEVIDATTQLEMAKNLLKAQGSYYVKRSSTAGFYAFFSASPSYLAYNVLEDAMYSGVGFYVRGLFGEIWKVPDFSRIALAYVRDDLKAGNNITESDLLQTRPPSDEDCSACMPVRYRAIQNEVIAAVRAPNYISFIRNIGDSANTPTLAVNKNKNRFGDKINHGSGDMICCRVLNDENSLSASSVYHVTGSERYLDLNNLFVVNGLVFEKTYTRK